MGYRVGGVDGIILVDGDDSSDGEDGDEMGDSGDGGDSGLVSCLTNPDN